MEAQLTAFMKVVSTLGSTTSYCIIVPVFAGILIWRGYRHLAVAVALVEIGNVLNPFIKELVRRPRPTEHMMVHAIGYSFPSGHALAATVFYGFLIYIVATHPVPYRKALIVLCVVMIGLIGYSRIYLGVHYPSDILGGYLIGALWLAFFIPIARRYQLV